MIQVTKLYARSFDLDHMDLFWELADFFDDNILGYDMYVLRSESPGGPWEILAGPFQDQYQFRDVSPALLHKWRTLFYKLRIINRTTTEMVEFGPTAQLGEPDLIALEIMRQEDVLFREYVGRRCWLYPVRTFGAKCTCFDRVGGRRTRSNCLTCYDTGYIGGFLSPLECFVQFDPDPKSAQGSPSGEQQIRNSSARLISFPPVKPKDILIETENRRWRVATVAQTERLRARVHQELTIHELPKGDTEYKLPINIADLRSLQPAAERNFTNPQHADNDADLKNILAVYNGSPRGTVR